MKAFKLLLLILILVSGSYLSIADTLEPVYLTYFRATKKARVLALNGEYDASIRLLRTTFEQFDFEYARDCIHGVEIAAIDNNDSALKYFMVCAMKRGVPFSFFQEHAALNSYAGKPFWQTLEERSARLYEKYLEGINQDIRNEVNEMFLEDQAIRKRYYSWYNFPIRPFIHRKWKSLNKAQVARMLEITEKFGFPGERLIGIDPDQFHENISPTQFSAGFPIVIFIHHYSQPNVSQDSTLFQQMVLGYLYNEHFACIRDFQVRFGRGKYTVDGTYALRQLRDMSLEKPVMERRENIGLLQSEEMTLLKASGILSPFWFRLY